MTTQATAKIKSSAPNRLTEIWLKIVAYGLSLVLVVAAVGLAQSAVVEAPAATSLTPAPTAIQTGFGIISAPPLIAAPTANAAEVLRQASLHTTIPDRPTYTVQAYTVAPKDTVFSIAGKFSLKPETILWGNPALAENPGMLSVGQVLMILPTNGALRVVQPGDTLELIAKVFHGQFDEIINYPGNDIDPVNPQIREGQAIIVPGGWRELIVWQAPKPTQGRKTVGRSWGNGQPGACAGPFSGANGFGEFVWPAGAHTLSGWNYGDQGGAHLGIDIAAGEGAAIYTSDSGVVVFAGWNTWGYGNMIMIDHGNGWQTLYGHLSQINVKCGQSVYQGNLIGLAGNTGQSYGAHLHFEMQHSVYGRVNPWTYLPPP